jgi:hypothetical protein
MAAGSDSGCQEFDSVSPFGRKLAIKLYWLKLEQPRQAPTGSVAEPKGFDSVLWRSPKDLPHSY